MILVAACLAVDAKGLLLQYGGMLLVYRVVVVLLIVFVLVGREPRLSVCRQEEEEDKDMNGELDKNKKKRKGQAYE